ncbi:MAG TPA: phytoene/squalene synthase family protein [Verrucomicrobiota bacterium]|nr:phytoene/squalene synthase family protein [Verrucomicrobiota bacterium]
MTRDEAPLLTDLLRDVSRSFYQTLRLLPGRVRGPISLAYLLARATDTVADTELVPVPDRLRRRILGERPKRLEFGDLAARQADEAERVLLTRIEEAITALEALPGLERGLVREVLRTITSGQMLDVRRFAGAGIHAVRALATEAELDDYTYRVAGCVGEFWTDLCRTRLFPRTQLDDDRLRRDGVRFGQGLQLVNILRDLPRDLRQGRCYLPADALDALGLTAVDLLDPDNEPRLRPVYQHWLHRAQGRLAAGWRYTLVLPWRQVRVRLACAMPVLIGVRTLRLLEAGNPLDPDVRLKIPRAEVKRLLRQAVLRYPVPSWWAALGPQP